MGSCGDLFQVPSSVGKAPGTLHRLSMRKLLIQASAYEAKGAGVSGLSTGLHKLGPDSQL